jgi:hypothetical protein
MKELLFEDPFWLYVLLVLAESILLWIWKSQRTRQAAIRLLVPAGLGALVFAVATLVVTDREKITRATHEIVETVSSGQISTLEKYLDKDFHGTFRGESLNRAKTLARARDALRRFSIRKVELKRLEVKVSGQTATVRMLTGIRAGGRKMRGQFPVIWRIEWIKRGKQWTILSAGEPRLGTSW